MDYAWCKNGSVEPHEQLSIFIKRQVTSLLLYLR